MKVHEVIANLQNFPMDADVYCLHEEYAWDYNEEDGSYEITIAEEGLVKEVIARISGYNDSVIIK